MELNIDQVLADLVTDEGCWLFVYDDATGKPIVKGTVVQGVPTIGIGRNLATHGLSPTEMIFLARNDILAADSGLAKALPWYSGLDAARKRVLVEMAFNLGITGLLYFTKMLRAIRNGQWEIAAAEMLDSHWSTQVGKRAQKLAQLMRDGG